MSPNNLNIIRLVAAFLVLYGHSFVFLGLPEPIFLSWNQLGPLGVFIFFIISGYLITESWERDPHLGRFFARRALRIFPGLAVCIVLTIFILGPILTTLSLKDYVKSGHTWGHLRNIALYPIYYLPGVFETNRVPNAVNGSLWSLPAEFSMYIIVAVVGFFLRGNRWAYLGLTLGFAITAFFWAQQTTEMLVVYGTDLRQVFMCGIYFWVGAVFYKFDIKQHLSLSVTVLAVIALLCLEGNSIISVAAWILLPIVTLAFGFAYSPSLNRLIHTGDYSYGIYIYAFPIQQTIVYLYPKMPLSIYLPICFTLTLVCAILSWHLVESRVLALKPRKPRLDVN